MALGSPETPIAFYHGQLQPYLAAKGFHMKEKLQIRISEVFEECSLLADDMQWEELEEREKAAYASLKAQCTRFLVVCYETDKPVWLHRMKEKICSKELTGILVKYSGVPAAKHYHLAIAITQLSSETPTSSFTLYWQLFDTTIRWTSDKLFGDNHRALQNLPPPPSLTYRKWLLGLMDNPPTDNSKTSTLRWLQNRDKQISQHQYTCAAHTILRLRKRHTLTTEDFKIHLSHLLFHLVKSIHYFFQSPPLDKATRKEIIMKCCEITKIAWSGDSGYYESIRDCAKRILPGIPTQLLNIVVEALTSNLNQATFPDSMGHYYDSPTIEEHDGGTDWEGYGSVSHGVHFEEEGPTFYGWLEDTYDQPIRRSAAEYDAYRGRQTTYVWPPQNQAGPTDLSEDSEELEEGELRESKQLDTKRDAAPGSLDTPDGTSEVSTVRRAAPVASTFDLSDLPKELVQHFKDDPQRLLLIGNIDLSTPFDHDRYFLLATGTFGRHYGSPHKTEAEKAKEIEAKKEKEERVKEAKWRARVAARKEERDQAARQRTQSESAKFRPPAVPAVPSRSRPVARPPLAPLTWVDTATRNRANSSPILPNSSSKDFILSPSNSTDHLQPRPLSSTRPPPRSGAENTTQETATPTLLSRMGMGPPAYTPSHRSASMRGRPREVRVSTFHRNRSASAATSRIGGHDYSMTRRYSQSREPEADRDQPGPSRRPFSPEPRRQYIASLYDSVLPSATSNRQDSPQRGLHAPLSPRPSTSSGYYPSQRYAVNRSSWIETTHRERKEGGLLAATPMSSSTAQRRERPRRNGEVQGHGDQRRHSIGADMESWALTSDHHQDPYDRPCQPAPTVRDRNHYRQGTR